MGRAEFPRSKPSADSRKRAHFFSKDRIYKRKRLALAESAGKLGVMNKLIR